MNSIISVTVAFWLLVALADAKRYHKCTDGIKDFSHTQHCSGCHPPEDIHLELKTLTIGNENNTIYSDDLGEMCIEGSAKIPEGFVKPTDTLDLRTRLRVGYKGLFKVDITCAVVHGQIEKMLFPERYDEEGERIKGLEEKPEVDESDERAWIKKAFNQFDIKTCSLSDVCGLLKPGEGLRKLVDELVSNSTEDLGGIFDNYNTTDENPCSTDFLEAQIQSLNDCYTMGKPSMNLDSYKALTMGQGAMSLEVTLELMKRDTTRTREEQEEVHVLCIFLPLHVVFR